VSDLNVPTTEPLGVDDIVTALRHEWCGCVEWSPPCPSCEAAAEIERLRAAGDRLVQFINAMDEGFVSDGDLHDAMALWKKARRG
jgi:hypothetical protein